MEQVGVIVVAAGKGLRMGGQVPKQHLPLAGKPVLVHTLEAFENMEWVHSVVLVIGAGDEDRVNGYLDRYKLRKVHAVLTGGPERQASVYQGLLALDPDVEWVLVHDGVRPFVTPEEAADCLAAAKKHGAAVVAVPVKDTVKIVEPDGRIVSTPDRSAVWAIQTPQAFRVRDLLAAHELAVQEGFTGTDDAMLAERTGQPVYVVRGGYDNLKITTPEDLEWADYRLKHSREGKKDMVRVGQGFDVHRLVEGRKCIIGGVDIPYERGLLGHSDADVLLHAVSDAILGAIGKGDIGRHFPDTDPAFKDADSVKLMEYVWALAKGMGYALGNLDATIIAQKPKMAPYIPQMVKVMADTLETDEDRINIKATTTEQLGFTGRGEGIAAQAVVCLLQEEKK